MPRVFGLDLLRALAVSAVLLAHASFVFWPMTHRVESFGLVGQLGVEMFFVLSGFLIGGILADQAATAHFELRRFWTRRWLRTLPNYYLFLAINVLIERCASGAWPHAASYAIFMQNFAWPQPMFFIESWSLSVEEIFYFVAPLLMLPLRGRADRFGGPLMLMVIGIATLTAIRIGYVLYLDPSWDLSLRMVALVRLDAIAYGVVAMWLCRRSGGFSAHTARIWALLGIVGLCLATVSYFGLPRDADLFSRTLWFSLTSASFAALLPFASRWLQSGWPPFIDTGVRAIARWSYALYLSQLAVLRAIVMFIAPDPKTWFGCLLLALAMVAGSIVCAALVYRFFESPILRWRDQLTRASRRGSSMA